MALLHWTLGEQRIELHRQLQRLQTLYGTLRDIIKVHGNMVRQGIVQNTVKTEVQNMMDELEQRVDEVVTSLTAMAFNYGSEVFPSPQSTFEYLDVVVASKATIAAKYKDEMNTAAVSVADPFASLTAGDTIQISNAEDSNHNGYYVIDSVNAGLDTITLTGGLAGADNTEDTHMHITLRNEV